MDPMAALRTVRRAAGFLGWTATAVYGHQVLRLVDSDFDTPWGKQRIIHFWSHRMFPLLGLDLRVVSGELPYGLGPYLVVANHRSPLDILVCIHLAGGVVLSHHGVASYPFVGTAAKASDTIFVDRDDQKSGAAAIRQMRRRLVEGRNVIVFPEGTTFTGDEVRPFKRGAFSAGKGLDVKVLPIGLAYRPGVEFVNETFGQHALRAVSRRQTTIWASVGEPQPVPRNEADTEALRSYVQSLVDGSAKQRDAETAR